MWKLKKRVLQISQPVLYVVTSTEIRITMSVTESINLCEHIWSYMTFDMLQCIDHVGIKSYLFKRYPSLEYRVRGGDLKAIQALRCRFCKQSCESIASDNYCNECRNRYSCSGCGNIETSENLFDSIAGRLTVPTYGKRKRRCYNCTLKRADCVPS